MRREKVSAGIFWVEVPEIDLRILCGTPSDSIKHLMKRGLVTGVQQGGVAYETGPNAILLSEVSIQKGDFANLAEFPILHMFYKQGMIIPNHPGNKGIKPLLIGIPEELEAQRRYIFRGNYGLVSEEELLSTGLSEELTREHMRMKLGFAFGRIRPTEEMVDMCEVRRGRVDIRDGAFIERVGLNQFRIGYGEEAVEIDLNLEPGERFVPAYVLGRHKFKRHYFSILHIGEGNGWDHTRPCMSSLITFQQRLYLIDAGPHITHSLDALGISMNEIEGVFQTHGHDDHFAGLTSLVRADHRLKYFATPLVRESVTKKLSALMGFPESRFKDVFEPVDLVYGEWNSADGLEVLPLFSPHPVETTIMFFRALSPDGYRSYAHLADIISFENLDKLVNAKTPGLSRTLRDEVRRDYLKPADIKKIDIDGGLIHGAAVDFTEDESTRILLSHTNRELTDREKEIGSNAEFGMQDVLIPSADIGENPQALEFLRDIYPDAANHDLAMLANCPVVPFNAASIVLRAHEANRFVYLVLSGIVEVIDSEAQLQNRVSVGSLLGDYSAYAETRIGRTYRTLSYSRMLEIPSMLFAEFVRRNNLGTQLSHQHERRYYLEGTWLFGEQLSASRFRRIVNAMAERDAVDGELIEPIEGLVVIRSGVVELRAGEVPIGSITDGDFFGANTVVEGAGSPTSGIARGPVSWYYVPKTVLVDIPIVGWKLLETAERRRRLASVGGCT